MAITAVPASKDRKNEQQNDPSGFTGVYGDNRRGCIKAGLLG
jgi:hypothetical protein